ncbi:unnamed protein product [Bathycoccus prasinos]
MRVITFEDRFPDDVFVFSETKVELVGVLFCLVRARERRKNISVKNTFEIINGKKRSKNTIETHPRPAALVHFYPHHHKHPLCSPHACPFNLTPRDECVNRTSMSPFFSELFVGMRIKISTSVVLCCHRTRSFLGSRARYFCLSELVIRERLSSEDESNAILISSFPFVASEACDDDVDDVDIFLSEVFP